MYMQARVCGCVQRVSIIRYGRCNELGKHEYTMPCHASASAMSYHIISYHIMLCYAISYHIPYHIISYIMPYACAMNSS